MAYSNNPGEVATKKFMMYHIQLPAFRREHKTLESVKHDTFLTWLYALNKGYQNEQEMEALSDMSEGLSNFAARYNYAINDPELIRRYRFVEDGKRDIATRISVAEKRGEKNKAIEVAKALKQNGIDISLIAKTTGLTLEEVNNL